MATQTPVCLFPRLKTLDQGSGSIVGKRPLPELRIHDCSGIFLPAHPAGTNRVEHVYGV